MEKDPSNLDFNVGTLVLAKMTGFPYWPGIVTDPTKELKEAPAASKEGYRCIFFFGSRNYSWIEVKKLKLYSENKDSLSKTTKTVAFRKSCEEIENFIKKGLSVSSLLGEEDVDTPPSSSSSSSSPIPSSSPLLSLSSLSPSPSDKTSESLDVSPKCSDETKQNEDSFDKIKKNEENVFVEAKKADIVSVESKITKEEAVVNECELQKSDDSSSKSEDSSSLKNEESSDENKESSSSEIEDLSSLESEEDIPKSSKESGTKKNVYKRKSGAQVLEKDPKKCRFSTGNEDIERAEFISYDDPKPSTSYSNIQDPDSSSLESNADTAVESSIMITEQKIENIKPKVNPSEWKIGFIGIGKIGAGMVKNLLNCGNRVTIWNRTQETCEESINAGAQGAMTPGDVIEDSDITFCCVSDDAAAKEIVFGNCGVLPEIKEGKSYVEMSGISDLTSLKIGNAISASGGRYLEVRLQGGKTQAHDGTLILLAAGDKTLYDDCHACFDAFSIKRLFLGEVGKASFVAPILNSLHAAMLTGCYELLAMSDLFNFSKEDLLTFCEEKKLLSPFILKECRSALKGDFTPEITIKDLKKDTEIALQYANRHYMGSTFIANAHEYVKHSMSLGFGEFDISKLAVLRK